MNYANRYGYSDTFPFEVVRKVSDKTLEIRAMNYERDPSFTPEMIPGGFCAHTTNQNEQKWIITSDETAPVIRIRLGKNGWRCANGNTHVLSDKPIRFYDYNF